MKFKITKIKLKTLKKIIKSNLKNNSLRFKT